MVKKTERKIRYLVLRYLKKVKNFSVTTIRIALSEAFRTGLISEDISKKITNLKKNTVNKRGILSLSEIKNLVLKLEETPRNTLERKLAQMIIISLLTGMRLGEIRAMKPSSIEQYDSSIAFIKIDQSFSDITKEEKCTKSGKPRTVSIPLKIAEEILSEFGIYHNDYLFPSLTSKDKPIDKRVVGKFFSSTLEAIGIPIAEQKTRNITFHSLRHCSATLAKQQTNIETASKLLGHSSTQITKTYADHEVKEFIAETGEQMLCAFNKIGITFDTPKADKNK